MSSQQSSSNSVTVSSVYTGPISSGQVSVLNSGSNSMVTQTIPVGNSDSGDTNFVKKHTL